MNGRSPRIPHGRVARSRSRSSSRCSALAASPADARARRRAPASKWGDAEPDRAAHRPGPRGDSLPGQQRARPGGPAATSIATRSFRRRRSATTTAWTAPAASPTQCPGEAALDARLEGVGYLSGGLTPVGLRREHRLGHAASTGTPEAIVKAWMNSSGHRANILSRDFREIGVGFSVGTPDRRPRARRHLHDRLRPPRRLTLRPRRGRRYNRRPRGRGVTGCTSSLPSSKNGFEPRRPLTDRRHARESVSDTRSAPRRRDSRRRWQLRQTTSHFSISSRMLCQFRYGSACPMSNALVAQVVELQNDRIRLAAVDARMARRSTRSGTSCARGRRSASRVSLIDVALLVRQVVLAVVVGVARAAVVVPLALRLAPPSEVLDRLELSAASARLCTPDKRRAVSRLHEHIVRIRLDTDGTLP